MLDRVFIQQSGPQLGNGERTNCPTGIHDDRQYLEFYSICLYIRTNIIAKICKGDEGTDPCKSRDSNPATRTLGAPIDICRQARITTLYRKKDSKALE